MSLKNTSFILLKYNFIPAIIPLINLVINHNLYPMYSNNEQSEHIPFVDQIQKAQLCY